ncbi:hypothetical protein HU200_014073 [Digitaria exilis]|uniref:Uncharacterized protein n=1 Tax=Digitaria exilis TaxID=1010633 RepID=A0A835KKK1_9POAL|nr:hypothetical protein HU200_014073 [Digitaria exilis]
MDAMETQKLVCV